MSEMFDALGDSEPGQRVWAAVIAETVTDFATKLSVVIPGLDATLRWKECKWQARNDVDFPHRGNSCLIIMDDNQEIWVVAWWPF